MPIQRDVSPDLDDPRICDFLHAENTTYEEAIRDAVTRRRRDNYNFFEPRKIIAARNQALFTFVGTPCDLVTPAGRVARSVRVIDPVEHTLSLQIVALLFIRRGTSPAIENTIITAFNDTKIGVDSIDDVETNLIKSGVEINDYQVDLSFQLVKVPDPKPRLEPDERPNRESFIAQVNNYRDSTGQPYHQVRVGKEVRLCTAPNLPFPDRLEVDDVNNPQKEIAQKEREAHPECEGLVMTDTRIGTAFQFYEWKIEWLVRPITIQTGKYQCIIMYTKIPIIFSRITKMALWGYAMSHADTKASVENALLSCLVLAAANTGVLAIVVAELTLIAAAIAFSISFFACIETKVTTGVTCLFTNLRLVAEHSEWQEKVF